MGSPPLSGSVAKYSTPKKVRIQGAIDFLEAKGIPHHKNDIFRFYGASRRSGWRALAEPREFDGRRLGHTILRPEQRGRPSKLSASEFAVIERFIDNNGFDGHTVPWAGLPAAAGLDVDVCRETVRRAVKDLNLRILRPVMLERYPDPADWRHIRFSDECHFGWGPQGKKEMPAEKDMKRIHCWAAVGYDFKSSLTWYDVPGNSNGKMSMQVYRDHILEPVVGGWLREGQSFVLEEDNDSGHGTSKSNIVRTWKKTNGLDYFFNCASSPDFSPIEKAWQGSKEYVKKRPCWEDDVVKELAEEGWAAVKQETINGWVDEIPQIFKECSELEGGMTGN
ncbi:hypothetical protein N657DRAFT_664494 [Parathielavia appendiculata]|uniref:Tc1-like transposase DDE domain-containing protein n=1 Tax=Parathielavia appendiculata TaxID=2587402 RepID=A0AAN6TXP4_9PEZI|nr:hypothetical protein N657DRAFT_664494 [Parathielavia appendiculata]